MTTNERPGVYTSYTVDRALQGYGDGCPVGLAAAAAAGQAGQVTAVADYATALSTFGGGNMTELVRVLLENGAPVVYCCPVVSGNYDAALAALMTVEEVRFLVCDSRDSAVHAKLRAAIAGGDEKCKYRLAVVESGDTTRSALVSDAQALNSERVVLLSHHCTEGVAGALAAAVCGVMAGQTDPAVPLNGAELRGVDSIGANFSDGDLTLLVQGGVLPLETVGGQISVVRGITTRTTTGSTPDTTWREVNTVLILDTVIPGIRDSLRTAFARAKNNAQTRGAIRTRVIVELERYVRQEIIDSYDAVTVAPAQEDPSVCDVSFSFGITHGLNVIRLSAHITV